MLSDNLKRLRKEKKITLEQLAVAIGTSRQTVHRYERGTIANIPSEKIEMLADALGTTPAALMGWDDESYESVGAGESKRIPMLGSIACGAPIYATEEYGNYVCIDSALDADFCLTAHGDSMIGARIYNGDTVFIRSQESVENGEIAAVIINDEATLKRVYYYPGEHKLVLSPENPRYAPMVFTNEELDEVKILGKAIAFQSAIL